MANFEELEGLVSQARDRLINAEYGFGIAAGFYDGVTTLLFAILEELVEIKAAVQNQASDDA